jgi:hypothetical protein
MVGDQTFTFVADHVAEIPHQTPKEIGMGNAPGMQVAIRLKPLAVAAINFGNESLHLAGGGPVGSRYPQGRIAHLPSSSLNLNMSRKHPQAGPKRVTNRKNIARLLPVAIVLRLARSNRIISS